MAPAILEVPFLTIMYVLQNKWGACTAKLAVLNQPVMGLLVRVDGQSAC